MGGCATKPKVLKEASAPEPAKEEKAGAADEPAKNEKEVAVVVVSVTEAEKTDKKEEEDDKVKEIVDDDRVDEQESKHRSLSHLFKENEEGKDSTDGNPAVEPLKQEEPSVTKKPADESETKLSEVEKSEIRVEQTPVPDVDAQKPETPLELTSASDVVDAPEKAETEKTTETAPAAETKTDGTSDEKKTEDPDVADAHKKAETEKAIEATPAVETQTNGSEVKKQEAPGVPSAHEKAETQKPIETTVATETKNDDTSEKNKTEEKESAEERPNV